MRETAHRKRNQLGCRLKRFYAFVYARRVGRDRNARQPVAQRIRLRPRIILRAAAGGSAAGVCETYIYIYFASKQATQHGPDDYVCHIQFAVRA